MNESCALGYENALSIDLTRLIRMANDHSTKSANYAGLDFA